MSDSEFNGNVTERREFTHTISTSTEDLSAYTDADESISAPTEILAEFLSSIMMKDYEKALKFCMLILNYEPNNTTAKDFHPLIVEKLEMMRSRELQDSLSESSESCDTTSSESNSYSDVLENEKYKDSDGTSASCSSLEEDENDIENNAIDVDTFHLSAPDIVNGNIKSAKVNKHPHVKRKNKGGGPTEAEKNKCEIKEGTMKEKTPRSPSPTSQTALIRPTATRIIKQNGPLSLIRTETYTKNFPVQPQNISLNNNCRIQNKSNLKVQSLRSPTEKNTVFSKKISISSSVSAAPEVKKKIQGRGELKSQTRGSIA